MPRQQRYFVPGIPQHVTIRGVDRQATFFAQDDYELFLAALGTNCRRFGCALHAYVLMTNHVHMLMTPATPRAIPTLIQAMGRDYVQTINRRYARTGTLWEGRYKASLVAEDNYLLACMRYIELNPVRAVMVEHPGDYRWSSYHYNAYGKPCGLDLTEHDHYTALSDDDAGRRRYYRELFSNSLDAELIHSIRQSLNSCLVLGNERFKDEIEARLKRKVRPGKAGRPSRQCQSDPD